jgi:hypothetical protein
MSPTTAARLLGTLFSVGYAGALYGLGSGGGQRVVAYLSSIAVVFTLLFDD